MASNSTVKPGNRWDAYWHQGEIQWSRLVALRWALFGLIAFDIWSIMLTHAARIGAGGFNVAQMSVLDAVLPTPTPAFVAVGMILGGFFALRAAVGIAVQSSMVLATFCYFGIYLWSQSDSYQHHYFVGLLMTLACLIPQRVWSRGYSAESQPWHWTIRLIYIQVALLYFWTAVTKCDATWLSGQTMDQLTSVPAIRDTITGLANDWSMSSSDIYRGIAWATMLGEFFAALVFLVPKLRTLGLFIVPWFHIAVEVLGFDIEWFSYYMIAIDFVLLMPSVVWHLGDTLLGRLNTWIQKATFSSPSATISMVIAVGLATGVYLILQDLPFPLTAILLGTGSDPTVITSAQLVASVAALATFVSAYPWSNRALPLPSLAAALIVPICLTQTIHVADTAYDFYRMWGGDLRRRGELDDATQKYVMANRLHPQEPARRRQLGELYERLNRHDEALPLFQTSVEIMSNHLLKLERMGQLDVDNIELLEELTENYLRKHSNCTALERGERRIGKITEAAQARECQDAALTHAKDAISKLAKLGKRAVRKSYALRRQLGKAAHRGVRAQKRLVRSVGRQQATDNKAKQQLRLFQEYIRLADRCTFAEGLPGAGRRSRESPRQCSTRALARAKTIGRTYQGLTDATVPGRSEVQNTLRLRVRQTP